MEANNIPVDNDSTSRKTYFSNNRYQYSLINGTTKNGAEKSHKIIRPPEAERNETAKNKRNYPPCTFVRVLKTVATYAAFFGVGMGISILGATILQLERQTNSSTKEIASLFTWKGLGLLVGNVFIGLVFDRFPPEIILGLSCLVMSAVVAATPFCTSLVTLTVVIVINGIMHGILGAGNSYMIKSWRLKAPPLLQALHFIISFGSTISPLVVDLFVSDLYKSETPTFTNTTANITISTDTKIQLDRTMDISNSTSDDTYDLIRTNSSNVNNHNINWSIYDSDLLYPYIITSLCFVFAGCLFAWAIIIDLLSYKKKSLTREDSFLKQQGENNGPIKNKPLMVILLIYIMIYGGLESSYGGWILAFSVKHLHINFDTATLIATAFWGSFAGGRAISIVTSKVFAPEFVSCFCHALSTIALLVQTMACTLHPAVTWVCSIIVGLSFAPVFGNCIAFSQRELNISGRATTAFVFFLFLGFMGMPALVGYLFAKYSPIYFLHILSAGSVFISILLFSIVIYMRCIKKS